MHMRIFLKQGLAWVWELCIMCSMSGIERRPGL